MKTVIDAVNEFEGEADGNYIYVGASSNDINKGNLQETYTTIHNEKWWLLCTRDQFNDLVSQMETNFGKCEQSYSDYKFDYHLPPEVNPVYTQAMADNGELPSVGMECLIKMIGAYLPVTITYNSEHVIAFTYKTDNGVVETCKQKELHNIDIKPLTPPIELIDGGRYEIEFCFGDYRMVYYKKSNHSFYDSILCDSKVCHASSVKNIQPLTVEVK